MLVYEYVMKQILCAALTLLRKVLDYPPITRYIMDNRRYVNSQTHHMSPTVAIRPGVRSYSV